MVRQQLTKRLKLSDCYPPDQGTRGRDSALASPRRSNDPGTARPGGFETVRFRAADALNGRSVGPDGLDPEIDAEACEVG
jgi:hypothetical protein